MTLDELKVRLGDVTATDDQLHYLLEDAVIFVESACGRTFPLDETFPKELKPIITKYIRYELAGDEMVKSESIGGMTQTYNDKEDLRKSLISELSRLRLRKLRFTPIGR